MSMLGCMEVYGAAGPNGEPGHTVTYADYICDGWPTQDTAQVQHLLHCIMVRVQARYPLVKTVSIQSDNASCYSCSGHVHFLLAFNDHARRAGRPTIREWVFTEAQTGKTALDAHFSYVQQRLNRYVQQDGAVVATCVDIYTALQSWGGIAGATTARVDFKDYTPLDVSKKTIAGIREVHHITFAEEGAYLRRFACVDEGMIVVKAPRPAALIVLDPPAMFVFPEPPAPSVSAKWHALYPEPPPEKQGRPGAASPMGIMVQLALNHAALVRTTREAVALPPPPPPHPELALSQATERLGGWAQKENRRNVGLDPEIEDKIRAMQREGTKNNRVTAEEALQRITSTLDIGQDGHQLLLLTVKYVQATMESERRKVDKEGEAPRRAAPQRAAKGKGKTAPVDAPPPQEDEEVEGGEEVGLEGDDSLNACMALRDAMEDNTA
jgi:hypothetical protein